MENNLETDHIQHCLTLAEKRFNRGSSDRWTTYDFEKLSESIQEVTGVVLSVTTLKRLWGKLSYTNTPATTTLNTLARYAGFEDWSTLRSQPEPAEKQVNEPVRIIPAVAPVQAPAAQHPRRRWPLWSLAVLALAFVLYLGLRSDGRTTSPGRGANYQFSSNKTVLNGVPNSVIFRYDASAAGEDTVYISQSWDVSRKFAVPKDQKAYSSIYYYPGYFRAKLMVGKEIVKEHDLMISSNGWLALADQQKIPVYFAKKEFLRDSTVMVDKAMLDAYNIPVQPNLPDLRFYYVKDMGGLHTADFRFDTWVKSTYSTGAAACQRIEVLILCKNDVFIIPLCAKGCEGDLYLRAGNRFFQSKDTDLSKFGRDLHEWVRLQVEAKDHQVRILVDGEVACSFTADYLPTEIVGVQYRFQGPGAVRNTRFLTGDRAINL
ncbi:hypothetical protein [Chitinophaga pinensis]|uniref:Uncharacterized protein n=1 Tax=Chitinophaga pinensis (strain ATCC 43595 / DSM 2588 / LMG 13176 / NBRC 15968 / NCIMB 11800 / UQM 2034) TaxID=485918 RepID=A0A979G811_CHIPD|nr:hypothetical protein [Chitinophaga pinensis]ACU62327.1 hypothetical protein Cpin_4893 [Chitinophaga pinensis DSM 2588]